MLTWFYDSKGELGKITVTTTHIWNYSSSKYRLIRLYILYYTICIVIRNKFSCQPERLELLLILISQRFCGGLFNNFNYCLQGIDHFRLSDGEATARQHKQVQFDYTRLFYLSLQ